MLSVIMMNAVAPRSVYSLCPYMFRPVLSKYSPIIINAEKSILEISQEVRRVIEEANLS
jgi:hypothetical protein